jgi:hypothetical protein
MLIAHFKQASSTTNTHHHVPSKMRIKVCMPCMEVAQEAWNRMVAWPLTSGFHVDSKHTEADTACDRQQFIITSTPTAQEYQHHNQNCYSNQDCRKSI